ncbi:MAG: hypothetical protein ACLT8C_00485 [Akkermansia muciniphila]
MEAANQQFQEVFFLFASKSYTIFALLLILCGQYRNQPGKGFCGQVCQRMCLLVFACMNAAFFRAVMFC